MNEASKIKYSDNARLIFANLRNDESESILIYIPDSRSLNELNISNDGKNYSLNQIINNVDINNYFIDKFNGTNNHLVYSDEKKGFISIARLKK